MITIVRKNSTFKNTLKKEIKAYKSITFRISMILVLLGVLLTVASCALSYYQFTDVVENIYSDLAYQLDNTVVDYIDVNQLETDFNRLATAPNETEYDRIAQNIKQSNYYKELEVYLSRLRTNFNATYIYIGSFTDKDGNVTDNLTFYIEEHDSRTNAASIMPGDSGTLDDPDNKITTLYNTGQKLDINLLSGNESNLYVSALEPIKNTNDKIVGIVACRIPITHLYFMRLNFLFLLGLTSFAILIFVLLFFVIINRKNLTTPLRDIIEAINSYKPGENSLSEELKSINVKTDIKSLADSIINLEERVNNYTGIQKEELEEDKNKEEELEEKLQESQEEIEKTKKELQETEVKEKELEEELKEEKKREEILEEKLEEELEKNDELIEEKAQEQETEVDLITAFSEELAKDENDDLLALIDFDELENKEKFEYSIRNSKANEGIKDFNDIFMLDSDKLVISLGSIEGDTVNANLIVPILKNLIQKDIKKNKSLEEIINEIYKTLKEKSNNKIWLSLWLGIYDIKNRILTFINAGYPSPLIKHKDMNFEYFDSEIGLLLENNSIVKEVKLKEGDELFIYSSGIQKHKNENNENYSEGKLLEDLNEYKDGEIETLLVNLEEGFKDHIDNEDLKSDYTMFIIKVKKS